MPVNKKQLFRLVRLVAQLKENRYPNSMRFAEEMRNVFWADGLNHGCSDKTIRRDIQTLKTEFNAPIKFDVAKNGFYLTRHDWTFNCPMFEDNEMLAAVLGARVAEYIFPSPMKEQIRGTVDHLLTCNNPVFLKNAKIDSLVIIPSNRAQIDADVFVPLFYAWQNQRICHIVYQDSKGKESERDFEPHSLVFFDGVWYTKGFCRVKKEPRTFAVRRIKSVITTGESFIPDSKIIKSATEEEIFDNEVVENVVVNCDEYLASLVQTHPLHPEQEVRPLPGGSCELHIKSIARYRLLTWVMHQCGRAEIVSPRELRKSVLELASAVTKKHSPKTK